MSDHNNWKPGDRAMVLCADGKWRPATCEPRGDVLIWRFPGRAYRYVGNSKARPLVEIDPEDREQVERLVDLLRNSGGFRGVMGAAAAYAVRASLREFANPTPPKPDEPLGHLAIVEDTTGRRWISLRDPRDGLTPHDKPWMLTEMDTDEFRNYTDIAVTKVIYEGVTE